MGRVVASRTSYAGLGRAGTAKNDPRASHINKCGKSFANKLSFTSPSPGNSYKWIDLVLTNAGPNSAGGGGGGRGSANGGRGTRRGARATRRSGGKAPRSSIPPEGPSLRAVSPC